MILLLFSLLTFAVNAESTFSCETTYDQLNIPHVKTNSREELFYCFGLNHGQDRAWEMDYFRRVAQGRNAEVLGFSQLRSDLMMRLLDLPAVAKKLWEKFPPQQKKYLEMYALGVNKGFVKGKLSYEFRDRGYEPESWLPEHSLIVLLLQSFDQTRKTFTRDYDEELLKEKFGSKSSELFNEDNLPWENTILKEGEYEKRISPSKTTYTNPTSVRLWSDFPLTFGKESGSNNWVISKNKSKSGNAILANDPHLDLKTPMFWYWIYLEAPDAKVIGASVPGVPVIASGTNGKVAWGLTNSYLNSADVVSIKDVNEEDLDSIRPTVYVKLGFLKVPFFFKSFQKLKSGHPVLPLETKKDRPIALRWTGYQLTPEEIFPMFDLFNVSNVENMDHLISGIGIPSWNFVFADVNGNIGYRLVGKTYRQTEKTPMGIPDMTLKEFSEAQYLLPMDRPHVMKPERGYIYTANNRHWPSDARFYGGRGYSHSFRGLRIEELLLDKQDTASFKSIQCDRQVIDARFLAPRIRPYLKSPLFNDWDFRGGDQSRILPVYRRFMDIMMEEWNLNEYALYRKLEELSDIEKDQLNSFFERAENDISGRTWGDVLRVKFPHLSKNDDWVFSPDIPGFGDTHSVDPGTSKWNSEKMIYEQTSGASMRMIIELKKSGPEIWLALPGINRFYDQKPDPTPWENWRTCQYSEVKM